MSNINSLSFTPQEDRGLFSKLYEDLKSLIAKIDQAKEEWEWRTIAAAYNIPSICATLKDQAACASAYISSQKSGEVCKYIDKSLRDDCYTEAAFTTQDILWCNFAENKEKCVEEILGKGG